MASTRSPSPAEARSPPATPLTPQSKLKALFATMDASSDDEQASRVSKPTEKAVIQAPLVEAAAPESAESSDEEEDIVRPRGRMAARMQAGNNSRQQQDTPERDSSPELEGDARERVKRMLQDATRPDTTAAQADNAENTDNQDQEEDSVTPRPRKLINRVRRSVTPDDAAPQREESPGLFVSPNKDQSPIASAGGEDSGSDADLPTISMKNKRFRELVAKKRAERVAREAEEERKKAARIEIQAATDDHFMEGDEDSDITDDEGGRKLTQEVRPTRKASKKALEEMNRETQRMNRSLQLAHEAKTRKKISKSSLFERFNFRPNGPSAAEKSGSSSGPTTPVSARHTDTEMKDAETPPTSPPALAKDHQTPSKAVAPLSTVQEVETEQDLPSLEDVLTLPPRQDKGKGIATAADLEPQRGDKPQGKRQVRVKLPIDAHLMTLDSDDELVVTETKKSKIDAIFDRIPAKKQRESRSMHALRYLAQIGSPGKEARKKDKTSLTVVELQAMLQQRARQQAKMERDRRFELLKAKGIHIQTEEEREREMAEVEDIVARARQEAEEIMQREREAAKQERKEKKENGEVDPLAWDDSEGSDDEYEEREEPSEIELSGSEDEGEDASKAALLDGEAESTGESEEEQDASEEDGGADAESDDEMVALPTAKHRRAKKHAVVLSDDDENDEGGNDDIVAKTPKPKSAFPKSPSVQHNSDSPQVPTSVLRSATKTFIPGLPVVAGGPAGLGLTQIFAGTLDESQPPPPGFFSPSQPMPTFTNLPDSQFSQQAAEEQANEMIQDSQPTQKPAAALAGESISQGIQINFSQTQVHGFESLLREQDATQLSQLIEPSQDGGFANYTPLKERFVEAPPPSTIETVALNRSQLAQSQNDSPLVQRRGKLQRRIAAQPASDDEADADVPGDMDVDGDRDEAQAATAFSLMKEAAAKEQKREVLKTFNKKKSKAKDMVEDQAEESEDEYAGLGGADGEDSDDDSNASVKDMIDDEHKSNEIDERKIAAFFADRERASDEKQVEKLFRDLTSGMLRRKRGADYDLSDSDDGGEARRRMKRRQFAKMQKALFADERISKVAENPRNQAFLRTIEDHGSDDEMDFLFEPTPAIPAGGHGPTHSASQDTAIPDSQPGQDEAAGNNTTGQASARGRLPAPQRRTRGGRKPTTLGEIRESLSNLLDEPGAAVIPASEPSSDSEEDDDDAEEANARRQRQRPGSSSSSNKENRHPRRRAAVVDRITLKRTNTANSTSSNASAAAAGGGSGGGRLAFAASSAGASGFKVPALLRRATTNSLMSNSSSGSSAGVGASASAGGFGDEAKIKKAAGKRSGINYFARENERRAAMAENEKRREAKKLKGVEGRSRVVGGLFGGGKFE